MGKGEKGCHGQESIDGSVILHSESTLAFLNNYRKRHGVPALGYDVVLGQNAAKWAKRVHDKVILLGRVVALYSHPHIEGENVFVSSGGGGGESGGGGGESGGIDGKAAVQRWYKEIEKYDFDANMFSLKTAQFTQLVWKRTRRLGIGGIYDPGRNFTVIVARFKPPGNIGFGSSFRENIFPPAKDPPPIMNQVESFPGSINGHNFGTNLSHQNKSEGTPTRAKAPALPHLTSNNKDAHNFGTISHSTSANKVTTTEKSVGIQAPQNPATTAPSPPTMKLIITEKIGPSLKILTKNVHHVTPKSIIPVTTTTTKPVTKKSVTTSLPHNYNNATGPVRMTRIGENLQGLTKDYFPGGNAPVKGVHEVGSLEDNLLYRSNGSDTRLANWTKNHDPIAKKRASSAVQKLDEKSNVSDKTKVRSAETFLNQPHDEFAPNKSKHEEKAHGRSFTNEVVLSKMNGTNMKNYAEAGISEKNHEIHITPRARVKDVNDGKSHQQVLHRPDVSPPYAVWVPELSRWTPDLRR
ncbi:uncharacterized protein LOC118438655 [Folsomia candida]|uniref:uncharacterized protein LOC118438655 n=1 Tax=Folsomia candida TaxID=158441 RepID=UPI001604DC52|nr:uncharacterized protein LOC118438655 [Folsomia candida]